MSFGPCLASQGLPFPPNLGPGGPVLSKICSSKVEGSFFSIVKMHFFRPQNEVERVPEGLAASFWGDFKEFGHTNVCTKLHICTYHGFGDMPP